MRSESGCNKYRSAINAGIMPYALRFYGFNLFSRTGVGNLCSRMA